jgi:hypothetical protein
MIATEAVRRGHRAWIEAIKRIYYFFLPPARAYVQSLSQTRIELLDYYTYRNTYS